MAQTRKKISIHDYPEHLNPFSESTIAADRGRFSDRLNKSGTWSSKISKRVNRSVTWIEKSWLGLEDSKKYKIQSDRQTCNGNHVDNNPRVPEKPAHEKLSSNSCDTQNCDYQPVREKIHEIIVNPNENSSTKCEEEKSDIKRKKKRPAPPPPQIRSSTGSASCEETISGAIKLNTSEEKNEEVETNATNISIDSFSSDTPASEEERLHSDKDEEEVKSPLEESVQNISVVSSESNLHNRLEDINCSAEQSSQSIDTEIEDEELSINKLNLEEHDDSCENELQETEHEEQSTNSTNDSDGHIKQSSEPWGEPSFNYCILYNKEERESNEYSQSR